MKKIILLILTTVLLMGCTPKICNDDCTLIYTGPDTCAPCDTTNSDYVCLHGKEADIAIENRNKILTDIACTPCPEAAKHECKCIDGTCEKRQIQTEGIQIANPASEYCIAHGGKLEIITAEDGSQSGICITDLGYVCDEWKYFRGECPCDKTNYNNCPIYTQPPPTYCKNGVLTENGYDDCGCMGPPRCKKIENYTIAQWSNDTCEGPMECVTPTDYLIRSSCPYTSMCINNTCAVICPAPFNTLS